MNYYEVKNKLSSSISKKAEVDKGVKFGENVVIKDNVKIGKDTIIGNNIIIKEDTIIGEDCIIENNSILGDTLISTSSTNGLPPLIMEDNIRIGSNVVILRGTKIGKNVSIGDLSLIKELVIINQDSVIGSGVIIDSNVLIGEAVEIGSKTYVSSDTIIEDFCNIGINVHFKKEELLVSNNKKIDENRIIVRKGSKIGSNVTILPGVTIDENVIVFDGSYVIGNLESNKIYSGNPAIEIENCN
jgi:acetyltransferase-like isoleucine patch superfamily enzyme